MAKIKYDVSNVEDIADLQRAPIGIYRAKVVKVDGPKESSKGNQMLEVQYHLTHDASGKRLKEPYSDLWDYPILDHDHPFVQARFKEFLLAFGMKPKGILDTDKIIDKSVQVKLKTDTDEDGEYRPRIGKVMALAIEEETEPEDEPEDEPGEEEEEEDEQPEAEEDEEEAVDLDDLDRAALKALIKDEGIEVRVLKSMSDDDIRAAIASALGVEDEEEPEDEEEDEEPEADEEDEGDGYDSMSSADLKAECAERELPTAGAKKVLVARLRKDDADKPF